MKISKLDGAIIATAPILMAYRFFIPGVSIAEAFMLLSLFFHLIYGTFWKSKYLSIIIFVFLILLMHLLYVSSLEYGENLGYLRLAKFFILTSFITLAFQKIEINEILKIIVLVIYLNCGALFLQYFIFQITGTAIPLVVPFLPLVNEDISLESINLVLSSDFRPGGFFMEPSHLSYYFFFSALLVFRSNYSNKNLILSIITIALLSTFSSFGFMSGLIVAGLLFINSSFNFRFFLIMLLVFFIPLNISFLFNIFSDIPQIARLISPESVAITGRFFAGQGLIDQLTDIQKIVGLGFGNFQMDGQVNGIAYLRLSFGQIGLYIIVFLMLLYLILNLEFFKIMFISILITISFFSSLLFTAFLPIITLNLLSEKN